MDSKYKIYIQRAKNELNLSSIILKISNDKNIQKDIFELPEDTYFSAVISHAYYSIFYMTKAYLIKKEIEIKAPHEHKKAFEEFKQFVEKGIIDVELLTIYQELIMKADVLLDILQREKGKRGKFTYRTLPQANRDPAEESLKNSKLFFKHLNNLCEQ